MTDETAAPAPAAPTAEAAPEAGPARRVPRWVRFLLLALLIAASVAIGKATGADAWFTRANLKDAAEQAGPLGAPLLFAATALGELIHIPGLVFVGVSVAVWGKLAGGLIGFGAAVFSVSVSFVVVRAVGGKALAEIERPFMKRMMARLEARPILTVFVLRLVLIMSPPLNYALALSSIRMRDYVVGSALGLAPPILVSVFVIDWLLAQDPATVGKTLGPVLLVVPIGIGVYLLVQKRRRGRAEQAGV